MAICASYFIVCIITLACNCYLLWIRNDNNQTIFQPVAIIIGINSITYQNYCMALILIFIAIYLRIHAINLHLSELCNQTSDIEIIVELLIIRKLVDKLCDIIENVKMMFAINTVIYITHFAFLLIFSVFSTFSYFMRIDSTENDLIFNFISLSWIFYYSPIFIFAIVVPCWIKSEGKKTSILFQKILITQRRKDNIYGKVHLATLQLNHRRPLMSCGLFVIDWKLLMTIIGSIFSYLIILMQFE